MKLKVVSVLCLIFSMANVFATTTVFKNYTAHSLDIREQRNKLAANLAAMTMSDIGELEPGYGESTLMSGSEPYKRVMYINDDTVSVLPGKSSISLSGQYFVTFEGGTSRRYCDNSDNCNNNYTIPNISIYEINQQARLQRQITTNTHDLDMIKTAHATKIQQLEQKMNELLSTGSIADAVHHEIKDNDMVSEAVAAQLTPSAIADGVKNSLEQTRIAHANDTSLPIGTFYIQGLEFDKGGYFRVWPAYNNGLLNCSNVGSGHYLIDMAAQHSNELVAEIMAAYVTDSQVKVAEAIQLQNNEIGQYCQIKSVSLSGS